jgi:hypothetical protein
MKTRDACLLSVLTLSCAAGCGHASYSPARDAGFELDPVMELNDDDVMKAYEAKPQLLEKMHLSVYSFDEKRAESLQTLVDEIPQVIGSYRLPSIMVDGKRRFERDDPYYQAPARPVSIKKLRLLAARAQSDVLVLFDYGYRYEQVPNGLVALAPLLVTTFFVPMADVMVESYLDAYVIDVRNGYLYSHLTTKARDETDYRNLFSEVHEELIEKQYLELEALTKTKIAKLFADGSQRAPKEPLRPEPPANAAAKAKPAAKSE